MSLLLLFGQAGVAFDAASNSGYQTAQSTYSWSHTCTGSDRFLTVGVSMLSVAGSSVSSITYNGVALSLIRARASAAGAIRAELWGLINPASGANTIVVTLSAALDSIGNAVSFSGVNQTLAYEAANDASATNVGAADATVDITTVANNDWGVDVVATTDTAITVGAGQTSRGNVTGTLGSGAMSTEGPKTPAGSVTMSWTDVGAAATWTIVSAAVRPTSATGISEAEGSASGTGVATGVGASAADAVGAATGTGTASGVGASTAEAVGSASGTGTATGIGASLFEAVGSASGTSTATATGASAADSVGSAAGVGTATAVGISTAESSGSAAGTGAASGVGSSTAESAGSASGTGAASGVGTSTAEAVGAASGTGTATAIGAASSAGVGSASGSGSAAAASAIDVKGDGPGRITGGTFSRGKWRNLKEAEEAERRARESAAEATRKKKRRALEEAARAAREAILDARAAEDQNYQLNQYLSLMSQSLQAATAARTIAETVKLADAARAYAKQAQKAAADNDDDEAIAMLLAA